MVPRLVNPATNPAGYMAAAGAVTAAAIMIANAVGHHGVINSTVIVSAVGAVCALFARQLVTPVSDPKNGAGVPLAPVQSPVTAPVIPAVGTAQAVGTAPVVPPAGDGK